MAKLAYGVVCESRNHQAPDTDQARIKYLGADQISNSASNIKYQSARIFSFLIEKKRFPKQSEWTLADCEWRAETPALKRPRLPLAPSLRLLGHPARTLG